MAHSYLGIISERGLELLTGETEHAAIFLSRRCYAHRPWRSVCCWATLDVQDAEMIHELIRLQLYGAALWRLNADAIALGTLTPQTGGENFADASA